MLSIKFKHNYMNTYQKLKKRVKELEGHIYTLVMKPESAEGIVITLSYKLMYNVETEIMRGDGSNDELKGVFNVVECNIPSVEQL